MTLTAPATASEPYAADAPPVTTSSRSTRPLGTRFRSTVPSRVTGAKRRQLIRAGTHIGDVQLLDQVGAEHGDRRGRGEAGAQSRAGDDDFLQFGISAGRRAGGRCGAGGSGTGGGEDEESDD